MCEGILILDVLIFLNTYYINIYKKCVVTFENFLSVDFLKFRYLFSLIVLMLELINRK